MFVPQCFQTDTDRFFLHSLEHLQLHLDFTARRIARTQLFLGFLASQLLLFGGARSLIQTSRISAVARISLKCFCCEIES